jgi:hypothetical protein
MMSKQIGCEWLLAYLRFYAAKMWHTILKIWFRLAVAMGIILLRWLKRRGW